MDLFLVRPRVAELVFRLYDRALPVDRNDVLAERSARLNDSALTLQLTPTGHILEYRYRKTRLVEQTTTGPPAAGCRLSHLFDGPRRSRLTLGPVRYEVELQAEVLVPEVFVNLHDELLAAGKGRGLLHCFAPHHRIGLTPLGLITVDPLPTGLAVATFHTFPAEYAVVKTQSLMEFS